MDRVILNPRYKIVRVLDRGNGEKIYEIETRRHRSLEKKVWEEASD